jgi:hypothetical protein
MTFISNAILARGITLLLSTLIDLCQPSPRQGTTMPDLPRLPWQSSQQSDEGALGQISHGVPSHQFSFAVPKVAIASSKVEHCSPFAPDVTRGLGTHFS